MFHPQYVCSCLSLPHSHLSPLCHSHMEPRYPRISCSQSEGKADHSRLTDGYYIRLASGKMQARSNLIMCPLRTDGQTVGADRPSQVLSKKEVRQIDRLVMNRYSCWRSGPSSHASEDPDHLLASEPCMWDKFLRRLSPGHIPRPASPPH